MNTNAEIYNNAIAIRYPVTDLSGHLFYDYSEIMLRAVLFGINSIETKPTINL